MPKISPIQNSFTSGELSDSIKGRQDIDQYYRGADELENFLVRPYGPALMTPGTTYVSSIKSGSSQTARLLPFVFNRTDAYIIEFGPSYFRFYTAQGQVLSGGSPYELAHSYTETQLEDVQFTQKNDVLYLTHSSHPPRQLVRTASTNWSISDLAFYDTNDVRGGPFLDTNTDQSKIIAASGNTGSVNLSSSTALFQAGHVGTVWRVQDGLAVVTAYANSTNVTATVLGTYSLAVPAAGTDDWQEAAFSSVRGYPRCVTFHERRLWFARTEYQPNRIWGSKIFVYDDFADETLGSPADDDPITIELGSDVASDIQFLTSTTKLIAGTFNGEYTISSGSSNEAITPSNIFAIKQTGWGSENIQPVKIGNFVYYVQRFAKKLREMFYFYDNDNYKSTDKTVLADHVTGTGIKRLAYQSNPDSVLWCLLKNGNIATFTREIDQEVQGWSRQVPARTTNGTCSVESIAVIPNASDNYDEVWCIINRTIDGGTKRYVELFNNPIAPTRQEKCVYSQCALEYDAYTSNATNNALSMSATNGSTVLFTCSANYFASGDVGNRIRAIDVDGVLQGEAEITGYTSQTTVVGRVKYAFGSSNYTSNRWAKSVTSLSGLDHLEGESVVILADGGTDLPNRTVSSGAISLGYNYFICQVGLSYDSKLYTMPFEGGSAKGTSQGLKHRIYNLSLRLYRSTLGIQVGRDEDNLKQVGFRNVSTNLGEPESLFTGIKSNITFNGTWDDETQIMIKNSIPLPVEILSIMPLVETNDK